MQDIFAKGDSRKPNGDKGAKTKPSQYTKKFKQMYGEQEKEQAKSDARKMKKNLRNCKRIRKLHNYNIAWIKMQRWLHDFHNKKTY